MRKSRNYCYWEVTSGVLGKVDIHGGCGCVVCRSGMRMGQKDLLLLAGTVGLVQWKGVLCIGSLSWGCRQTWEQILAPPFFSWDTLLFAQLLSEAYPTETRRYYEYL